MSTTKKNNVAVLIPAYNPDEKLLKLLDQLLAEEYKIVVVNDGSGKEFDKIFESIHDATVISYPQNKGKGGALKTGISYIDENTDCKYIITADADGQHTPKDIGKLADFLCSTNEKFVIGSRKFTSDIPFRSKFGNKLTISAYALASGVKIGDTQTGLRGFEKELFKEMTEINGDRYEYEINVLLQVAKDKIKINEIEIETIYIDENASSHFHPIKDSAKIYSCILKYITSSFSCALKYCISSLAAFAVDLIFSYLFIFILRFILTKENYSIFSSFTFENTTVITFLSTAIARVISSIFNFIFNQKVVFHSKEKTSSAAVKYFALAAVVLILNSALVSALESVTRWFTFSYIISQIVLFFFNYFIQKKFVFKAK